MRGRSFLDLKGRTFGRLTVIERAPCPGDVVSEFLRKQRWWLARCECSAEIARTSKALLNGTIRSCGCLALDVRMDQVKRMHERKRELAASRPRVVSKSTRPARIPSPRQGSPWTPELRQKLRELWDAGYSSSEIGGRLGFTKNAIVSQKRGMGLAVRASPIIRDPSSAAPPPAVPRPVFALPVLFRETVSVPVVRSMVARPEPRPAPPQPRIDAARTCQYIAGKGRPWTTCGKPAVLGKSWCPCHYGIVFITKRDRRDVAA